MLRMGLGLAAILAPLQLLIGDLHGLNTLKHQPIKIAAMEGHWDGSKPGDFHIFAWPDAKAETNHFAISIPRGSSLVLTHDPNGLFPGLKSVPPEDRPPVLNVFFGFRIMLAVGFFMIAAALYGVWLMWRGSCSTPAGFCALSRKPGGSALSPSLPVGLSPRAADSRGSCMGYCGRLTPSRRCRVPASPQRSRCSFSSTASFLRWGFITSTG